LYGRLGRAVLANPRYYLFVARRRWYTSVARRLAGGARPPHGNFFPSKLDLRLVYACNLRCKMCAQWGDTGTYFDFDTAKLRGKLELEAIDSVLRELVPHGLKFVDMEGGETFLYPRIIELFRLLKSYGLLVKPVTNGTLLEKYAREIVDAGVDAVHVSVDGDREAHNHVRGTPWAYDRTVAGLAAVAEERRRAGRHAPLLVVNFTMTRHNRASALRKLCEELRGRGIVDVLAIKASPIWVPQERGEAYEKLVEQYFGVRGATSWRGFVEDYRDFAEGAREVAATIRELRAGDYDFFVTSVPGVPFREIPRVYTDYAWDLGRSHCPIPYVEPTIDADGNVYPCNLFTDLPLSMGNIYERPFLDIWFGERYERFRQMLADRGGLLPICNRCCQLTEH
jgi:radical SAM protein with 4Fe4S-binding SPASM domain